MVVDNLANTSFDQVMECFLGAFANYYVPMPTDFDFYKKRWSMSNVQFDLSFGMFDEGNLVGFIVHAIGERNGQLVAYNGGTGVIPKYRGQRIVDRIYSHAMPKLKDFGIKRNVLEVITKNEKAIKIYKRNGFNRVKNYKCFGGKISINDGVDYQIREVKSQDLTIAKMSNDVYSWDNHLTTIKRGDYKCFLVLNDGKVGAYFIINESGYVAQFEVAQDNDVSWGKLFSAIKSISPKIRTNNVDDKLHSKIKNLHLFGLQNTVDQFEMEYVF